MLAFLSWLRRKIDMRLHSDRIYISGSFSKYVAGPDVLARWSGASWPNIDTPPPPPPGSPEYKMRFHW